MAWNSVILFGGVPAIPPPEVFENARKNNPLWYQIIEKAYQEFAARPENVGIYADPKGKGATLQQVWLSFTIFGIEPYCLLARPVPVNQMERITRVVRYSAEQLVQILQNVQSIVGEVNTTTLHYDGKTGHCIRIIAYDQERDRFIYHDPWPQKSLLCQENNMAGVAAQPESRHWSVTSAELERVVFAAFVFPVIWARLQGVNFDLMYDAWKDGEFFKFFHLHQIDERSENGMNQRMFVPGPFKDDILLTVDSQDSGKIVKASLLLNKDWMIKNFLLALDLSKSFVATFAPPPDKEVYEEISRALWNLQDPNFVLAMKDKNPAESVSIRCIHAFMGSVNHASVSTDLGLLSFQNVAHETKHMQEIVFELY